MGGLQRKPVAERAKTDDAADGDGGEIGVMAEGFPRIHVGDMEFDELNRDRYKRSTTSSTSPTNRDCARRAAAHAMGTRHCGSRVPLIAILNAYGWPMQLGV